MAPQPGPATGVVITNVVVKESSIVLEINGGPKKKKWYQHVQVGAQGQMSTVGGAPKSLEAKGSQVTLAFDKYVPEAYRRSSSRDAVAGS